MRQFAAGALLLPLLLPAGAAIAAPDFRAMGGADALLTADGSGVQNAEIGLSVRADARDLARRVDLRLDFRGREGLQGNSSSNGSI
jgi:hypothetical protein